MSDDEQTKSVITGITMGDIMWVDSSDARTYTTTSVPISIRDSLKPTSEEALEMNKGRLDEILQVVGDSPEVAIDTLDYAIKTLHKIMIDVGDHPMDSSMRKEFEKFRSDFDEYMTMKRLEK